MGNRIRVVMASLAALLAGFAVAAAPAAAKTQPALDIEPDGFFFCCGTQPSSEQFSVRNEGGSATGKVTANLSIDPGSLGDRLAITKDGCTGRSLPPGNECFIEITWLVGADTAATLTVSSHKTEASIALLGSAVP